MAELVADSSRICAEETYAAIICNALAATDNAREYVSDAAHDIAKAAAQ